MPECSQARCEIRDGEEVVNVNGRAPPTVRRGAESEGFILIDELRRAMPTC